ncbi:MAG: sugar transferase, partial [Geobacter sp.]
KPGVTSWGQVKYGYASSVEEMIRRLVYDLYYMKHRSLSFDIKIIIYTVGTVFKGKGV